MLAYCSVDASSSSRSWPSRYSHRWYRYWPYNLELDLITTTSIASMSEAGEHTRTSLKIAVLTMIAGTVVRVPHRVCGHQDQGFALRRGVHLLSMMPLSVPGLVLGLAYIFFFVTPTIR